MTRSKTRFRIVVICVLLLGGAMLSRALILFQERAEAVEAAEQATRDWSVILEHYTARTFETSDLLAEIVADHVRERGGVAGLVGDSDLRRLLVAHVGRMPGDYLMVVDSRGRPAAVTASDRPPDVDLSDREWFRAHAGGVEAHVGGSIFSRVTHEILFTFSRRFATEEGRFDGAFQVSLKSNFFESVRLPHALGPQGDFALWRADGTLVGRSNMSQEETEKAIVNASLAEAVKLAAVGTFIVASPFDGRERITSYRFLPRWGVVVTASVPVEAALAPWRSRVRESILIFTLLGVAGAAAGAWAMMSARRLEQTAQDLSVALGQKDNLLREMHHRVKNNLQMTMSLMRMSARRMKSEPVRQLVAEMEERLRSMSLLFEMVYRSDLTGELSLRHYVTKLVDTIGKSFAAQEAGIEIGVTCADIRMDADRLGTVGLLITEVMTNAMKHAFAGVAAPRIDLTITDAGERIEIVIADNGRGFRPETGERRSLGMTMIDAFVQQLEGESSLESDRGTTFRASIPRMKPDVRLMTPAAPAPAVGAGEGARRQA